MMQITHKIRKKMIIKVSQITMISGKSLPLLRKKTFLLRNISPINIYFGQHHFSFITAL